MECNVFADAPVHPETLMYRSDILFVDLPELLYLSSFFGVVASIRGVQEGIAVELDAAIDWRVYRAIERSAELLDAGCMLADNLRQMVRDSLDPPVCVCGKQSHEQILTALDFGDGG